MIRNTPVTDYWKAQTADGIWHIDGRDDYWRSTLCGRTEKPRNRPGTVGREQHVTCIQCVARYVRTSWNPEPVSSTSP